MIFFYSKSLNTEDLLFLKN